MTGTDRSRRPLAALLGLLAVLALAGCGGSGSDQAAEGVLEGLGGEGVDLDVDDGGVSIKTPDGELSMDIDENGLGSMSIEGEGGTFSSESGTDLPDDFPSFVYLPDGLEIVNASRQVLGDEVAFLVNGGVDGTPASVFAAIQGEYDVEPDNVLESGDLRNMTYYDVSGYRLEYSVLVDADGATVVSVGVHPTEG